MTTPALPDDVLVHQLREAANGRGLVGTQLVHAAAARIEELLEERDDLARKVGWPNYNEREIAVASTAHAVELQRDLRARAERAEERANDTEVRLRHANEMREKAEAERDALATIAAAQEQSLKGDGDGSTVLEEVSDYWEAKATQTERQLRELREGLGAALLLDKGRSTVLDAMLTWPKGSFGPIAIAAYESLVRRLAPLRALLSPTREGETGRPVRSEHLLERK